ncbi:hypothetical protein HDU85_005840, partial [Gaertneriomyces sp. JEL0708]
VEAIVARVYPDGHEVPLMDSEIAEILEGSFPWNSKFEAVKTRHANPIWAGRLAICQCGVCQKSRSTRPLGGGKPAVTIPDTRDVRDRFFDENTLRRLTDARHKRIAAKQQGTAGGGDALLCPYDGLEDLQGPIAIQPAPETNMVYRSFARKQEHVCGRYRTGTFSVCYLSGAYETALGNL